MAINSQADFYLDFGRYGDLRRDARSQSDSAIKAVARQFEGLMLQQMLSAMRSSIAVDEANSSSSGEFYQEMYDKQLAQVMAKSGGLGLARLIAANAPGLNRPGEQQAIPETFMAMQSSSSSPATVRQELTRSSTIEQTVAINDQAVNQSYTEENALNSNGKITVHPYIDNDFAELSTIEKQNIRWSEPLTFVADIWPHAKHAAGRLGINPGLLVAQAALETGWGQHTMKFSDGRNGFNLFGIKASGGWQGAVVARPSLEYRDGIMRNEVSRFRAYASAADSFDDYVSFIRGNSRYQVALQAAEAGNDEGFIRGIHSAGYATDPRYAEKILDIANGHRIRQFLAATTREHTGVNSHA